MSDMNTSIKDPTEALPYIIIGDEILESHGFQRSPMEYALREFFRQHSVKFTEEEIRNQEIFGYFLSEEKDQDGDERYAKIVYKGSIEAFKQRQKEGTEDKFLIAAKEVFDNLPFENTIFQPDSVNECARRLKTMVTKGQMSVAWINSVYEASQDGFPTYISLSKNWTWNFLTLPKKGATREELLFALSKADLKNAKVKEK